MYIGKLVAEYCPSLTGCRAVVEFKDVEDLKTIEITDDQLRLAFNSSRADVFLVLCLFSTLQSSVKECFRNCDCSHEVL